jgi:hypothetical protein
MPRAKKSDYVKMYTPNQYLELKPCPFCGSEAQMSGNCEQLLREEKAAFGKRFSFVCCPKCGVEGPVKYGASCRKTASKAWNNRVKEK